MTKEERDRLDRLEEKVDALTEQFSKYKGFVGGVIFTVSALWAVAIAMFSYFKSH